jgi:hypothetical protein
VDVRLYAIVDLDDDDEPEALLVVRHETRVLSSSDSSVILDPGDYIVAVPHLAHPERLSNLIADGATFHGMSEDPGHADPEHLCPESDSGGRFGRRVWRWLKRVSKSEAGRAAGRLAVRYVRRRVGA